MDSKYKAHTDALLASLRENVENVGVPPDILGVDFGKHVLCNICGETNHESKVYPVKVPKRRGNIQSTCMRCKDKGHKKSDFPETTPNKENNQNVNGVVCAEPHCHAQLQRYCIPYHRVFCHSDKMFVCKHCKHEEDCVGAMIAHLQDAHELEVIIDLKSKDNTRITTCAGHLVNQNLESKRATYEKTKEKNNAKKRETYKNRQLEPAFFNAKQISGDASDANRDPANKSQQTPESRKPHEQHPIRVEQTKIREKMSHTISRRLNWTYANTDTIRGYFRKYHASHREKRNSQAREYRVGNTDLKWKQLEWATNHYGHTLSITKEQAVTMYQQPCFYCNIDPGNASKSKLNGIDRIDSNLGYIAGNVVPCCPVCNIMKKNLNVELFIAKAAVIADHFQNGVQVAPTIDSVCEQTSVSMNRKMINLQELREQVELVQGFFNKQLAKDIAQKNKDVCRDQDALQAAVLSDVSECQLKELACVHECSDELPSELRPLFWHTLKIHQNPLVQPKRKQKPPISFRRRRKLNPP